MHCSASGAHLGDPNYVQRLCPKHTETGVKLKSLLRLQLREACRLNRQYRHLRLKHTRLISPNAGPVEDVCCPTPTFPSSSYFSLHSSFPLSYKHGRRLNYNGDAQAQNRKMFTPLNIGLPSWICSHCGASLWYNERVRKDSTVSNPMFSICCMKGRVQLPKYKKCPEYLLSLLDYNGGPNSRRFRENIRAYNSIFAFTSMGGHIDNSVNNGRGPYIFRINGQNHHRIGSLLPTSGKPKFAQLYFYDTDNEVHHRAVAPKKNCGSNLDEEIIRNLITMLNESNELAKVFRTARDRFHATEYKPISIRLYERRYRDGRRYNIPTTSEVAAVIDSSNVESRGYRDVVVEDINGVLKRINEKHPAFMAMQYPLLFPYGEDGFRPNIQYRDVGGSRSTKQQMVTMRECYAYQTHFRRNDYKVLLHGGRLFQQYVVDAYTCIEEDRLSWIKSNQSTLRCEVYNGLRDAVNAGDTSASLIGRKVILPSSFTGGPRYMVRNYQDAMAICRWAGYPDYFVTFTCNPKWVEIESALHCIPGQRSEDRPDIVSRVFHIKLMELKRDTKDKSHFGRVKALIYTIEFQKRGLPYAHILVFVCSADTPKTAADVDKVVSAEIPDIHSDPLAYRLVCQFMGHGPCGFENPNCPCMVNNSCSKQYPRNLCNETTFDKKGFVVYRRRNNGRSTTSDSGFEQDNGWVIPHNVDLTVKYQAHINVEICNKARSVKYLFKYINKGYDRASVVIEDNSGDTMTFVREINEVKTYLDCRYISASEASWRIFEFDIQYRNPAVERLMFHMPGEHTVYFDEEDSLANVQGRSNINNTMFTEWLATNKLYSEAQQITYVDFPTKWVWDISSKHWKMRQKGDTIGRIYYAHPTSGERFYLHMLLNVVKGPTCYNDIREVDGVVHETFKNACIARGLLDDDHEWDKALKEAAAWASPSSLRELFVTILLFCEVSNPEKLWLDHWCVMSEDISWRELSRHPNSNYELNEFELKSSTLQEVDKLMNKNGRCVKDFWQISDEDYNLVRSTVNNLIRDEESYDCALLLAEVQKLLPSLNHDQRRVFDAVQSAVQTKSGGFFFVYGSGGTGKTFLWKTIISCLRSEGKIVLAVAFSGIASLLLPGGRTAHSKFKIPINLDESSVCNISKQSFLADLLRQTDLIIWDEAPMVHRNALEAFEKSLTDIVCDNAAAGRDAIFGGKTVLLGGDFRQTLPVVRKGSREAIVDSAINQSPLWARCTIFTLTTNMRLQNGGTGLEQSTQLKHFSKWILDLGEGKLPCFSLQPDEDPTWVEIPKEYITLPSTNLVREIVNITYPNLEDNIMDTQYLRERCILAPTNDCVEEVNAYVVGAIGGTLKSYLSADSISPLSDTTEDQQNLYPPEFLHTLKVSGLPNHDLQLKVGVPVMLLRNLNQSLGLCNGTRLIVTQLSSRVIQAEIVTGNNVGRKVLIPRIVLTTNDTKWPFILRRRQFPVKVCFAMTINKSQGQTLDHVGIYLPRPVFTHGQLYVAISRTTSPNGLNIMVANQNEGNESYTQNIVYKEVFKNLKEEGPNSMNHTSEDDS